MRPLQIALDGRRGEIKNSRRRINLCFIGEYDKSVILTYTGAAFALLASMPSFSPSFVYDSLYHSGICDLFDGVVARRMAWLVKRFGIEIDSLCDMISFAALPQLCFSWLSCPLRTGQYRLNLSNNAQLGQITLAVAHFALGQA